jgi:AcrR family transcriptional regulator
MAARKKKGGHPNLSAEKVRATALRLIEEDGLDELSTRKLGRALGVEAMAIYWYYPSKEALLDAVVDLLMTKMDPRAMEVGGEWIDALRRLAHAYRALAQQYPKAFPLLATRRFATPGTYGFLERLFGVAREQGLDDRTIARWYRLVASYCSGVALNELAGASEAEESPSTELESQFPRFAAVSTWLGPTHYDEVFEFGLQVLLDGVEAEVQKRAAKRKNR